MVCISFIHPLCYRRHSIIESRHNPQEWVNIFVVEKGPNVLLMKSLLNECQP